MKQKMMNAIRYERTGSAEEVFICGKIPKPKPNPGEVLVRIEYSAVHPSDVKKRAGLQPAGFRDGYVIPHSDGAGTIEAVGDGVGDRIGERVWVYQAQFGRHQGTCAEYVAVPDGLAQKLPDNTDFKVGACIGIPILTAHRCVHVAGDPKHKTILITGAAGRVGYYAVQWAKLAHAKVIATAGSDENCQTAIDIGADSAINYREGPLVQRIAKLADPLGEVDHIVDVEFGKNIAVSVEVLKNCGTIATYSSSQSPEPALPFYPMMFKNISVHTVLVYNMSDQAKLMAIEDVNQALASAQLKHRIAAVWELSDAAQAHNMIETGAAAGSVLIKV